jgi:hypothetical protein
MAALTNATLAWVDTGFSAERQTPGIAIMLTVVGLLMGTIGAVCAAERRRERTQTSGA